MLTALLFLLCAAGLTALLIALTGLTPLWALLIFPLLWLLLQLGLVSVCYLDTLGVDRSKPLDRQRPLCRWIVGLGSELLCVYAGADVRFTGLELLPTDRRFLYVSNHRSLLDPLIVMGPLRGYNISFVSKPSNLRIPMAGPIAYAVGFLAIDRENDRKALKTILTAADYLKRDVCSIGIYPEGTRSKTGELLPFHAGSFKIAQRANVPVAVVCTKGTEAMRKRPLGRKKIELKVLALIEADRVKAMSTHELSELCRDMIRAELSGEADA